jgi:HAE1 family hydrophobic/amphiphilic exporter-1
LKANIDPFAIMLSIPMAVVGAIFSLLLLGSDLSLMSMIGIIMLMGTGYQERHIAY